MHLSTGQGAACIRFVYITFRLTGGLTACMENVCSSVVTLLVPQERRILLVVIRCSVHTQLQALQTVNLIQQHGVFRAHHLTGSMM